MKLHHPGGAAGGPLVDIERHALRLRHGTFGPAQPFDWLILYAICADESEYMSDRMEQVLAHLFPENQAL